ncbi:unnamed protein product [Cylicocyclus nassatus]|uniref:Uncharacterized protein n=1 Tax=Cylicocyclus nassatus TaxID=53992 RepID=A0AA36HD40_CYLNA|nr:unnamed protein product [Cylicocyclus nassatus]
MTTASRIHVAACPAVTKFCETRPSPITRRDEKIRAFARSVQEITESEEEEESPIVTPRDAVRSPFALVDSPFIQRRCTSMSSPLTIRKTNPPRLIRGLSDPGLRRPSFGTQPLSPKFHEETLGLPPIPEATSPVTPVAKSFDEKDMEEK